MDIYQTEDEQVEALKKWWKENGNSAIFGVVLGLGAIFGWREWQDYQLEQAASASTLYQQMVAAARDENGSDIDKFANDIRANYDNTAYAVFARLAQAKQAVENNELDTAMEDLRWAFDNTDEQGLRHIIKLRMARVLMAQSKIEEARKLVSSGEHGKFSVAYLELKADLLRKESKISDAREAYMEAIKVAQAENQDTAILDMKLDDLGREQAK